MQTQLVTLLNDIYKRFHLDGNWQAATDKPLIGKLRSTALVDNELPSASGAWLSLASQLLGGNFSSESKAERESLIALQQALNTVRKKLPDTLEDNAFFHGTSLTALLKLSIQKHNQQEPAK